MEYTTINELVETAKENGISVGEAVLKDQAVQMEQTEEHLLAQMEESLQVMEKAVESGMDPGLRSTSGLTGGDAWKMMKYGKTGGITGSFMTGAMARALAVSEYNAAMGKIVAAPTAGSCGIMPGCLVSVMKERGIAREKILRGMFTAAASSGVAIYTLPSSSMSILTPVSSMILLIIFPPGPMTSRILSGLMVKRTIFGAYALRCSRGCGKTSSILPRMNRRPSSA